MTRSENSWRAVEELFYRVLEVEPARRTAALDEWVGDDVELRRDVASLLAAHEDAGDQMDGPVEDSAIEWVAVPGDQRLGPYRLLCEIGHGGMGVVWLAERADGAYQQQVAIKLIRKHVAREEGRRRFLAERQILARLEHPMIARLLDGGAAEDGTPYLVMEYVEGVSIDQWCTRQNLGVEQRLRLFLEVCDAVDCAHRQLIVHRDLKPSNILVDTTGRPRLLDFGIAKLINDDESGATTTVARRMTPAYASPEQVGGGTITTATDIYSLGAVLYVLLAGQPLFPVKMLTPAQLLDAVCAQTPTRPSTVVRQRSSGDQTPVKQLPVELDAIVMKALRKEPERRYRSVASLAADVRRHLRGMPVKAHSDRWTYLAGKWLRRNAAIAIAAGIVVLALLAGLVARTIEAQRANREAATAQRVSDFLVSLLAEADPESARGRDLTVIEAFDRGVEKLESDLADDPLVQARMLHVMGQVYKERGVYDEAERLLERGLAIRDRHGAEATEIADSLEGLGDLFEKQSRFEDAEETLTRALALREAVRPLDRESLSNSQTLLGIVLTDARKLDQAESLFQQAHALRVELYGEEHEVVAKSLNNLAWILQLRGDRAAAVEIHRRIIALKRRILPADHPSLAASLGNLAVNLSALGEHEEAYALCLDVLAQRRRVYGDRHLLVARAQAEVASKLHDQQRFDEAEEAYRQTLAIQTELFPDGHFDQALTINNLASLLEDRGDPAAAEPLFVRSLTLRRALRRDDHPAVARALFNLARVRGRLGRLEDSESLYREALASWRRTRPDGHLDIGRTLRRLGEILLQTGRLDEAEPMLEEALTIFADRPSDHAERVAAESAYQSLKAAR